MPCTTGRLNSKVVRVRSVLALLLIVGLLFPIVSWVSLALMVYAGKRTGSAQSGIFVPFIGPVLLDVWLVLAGWPTWWLFVPWLLDIGTLFFLFALPRMMRYAWQRSRFTRTLRLIGARPEGAVVLTFYRGGIYTLEQTYEFGRFGETGTYVSVFGEFSLIASDGQHRQIRSEGERYVIADDGEVGVRQLDGWILSREIPT